jgi:hypothetical protein
MSLRSLLKLASEPLVATFKDEAGISVFGTRGADLCEMLAFRNGFFAFEGALHVFPSGGGRRAIDLARFNCPSGWKAEYWHGCAGIFLFAANAFGDLYGFSQDQVIEFDPETGTVREIAPDIEGWAAWALNRCRSEIGWDAWRRWQDINGPLDEGLRLMPEKLFCLGGTTGSDNLRAVPLLEGLALRGSFSSRFRDLPVSGAVGIEVC